MNVLYLLADLMIVFLFIYCFQNWSLSKKKKEKHTRTGMSANHNIYSIDTWNIDSRTSMDGRNCTIELNARIFLL